MLTCLCNKDPFLTSHFYIVQLGFTGVYIFSHFAQKHRLWVFAPLPTIYVLRKNKKQIAIIHLKNDIFTAVKVC